MQSDIIFNGCVDAGNGWIDTTKYMREAANIQTPIVALTAHTSVEDRFCLDVGMNDFVTKPVRTKEITEAIDRLMLEV